MPRGQCDGAGEAPVALVVECARKALDSYVSAYKVLSACGAEQTVVITNLARRMRLKLVFPTKA